MKSDSIHIINHPRYLKSGANKDKSYKFLLLCYYDPESIATVIEMVSWVQYFSAYEIEVINLFEIHRTLTGTFCLPSRLNLNYYDAIIIHNTIAYNVENLINLDRSLKIKLPDYNGVKVLMRQDENYKFMEMAHYIKKNKFDVIFTCLPEESIPKVYPEHIVGKPKFMRMLTGYITPSLRNLNHNDIERDIFLGYRGSVQPIEFGRLAYEKRIIGEDVKSLLYDSGLKLNISSEWKNRLNNRDWYDFLFSCKAVLATESGASIFDLENELPKRIHEIENELGVKVNETSNIDLVLDRLKDLENQVYYNQIAPRHLEAAATKTLQVMFPGQYSGIFKPGIHYLELKRDYSNLDEIVSFISDENSRRIMVERAYQDVVLNEQYWIESFARAVDNVIIEKIIEKKWRSNMVFDGDQAFNVLLIAGHELEKDPRLDWVVDASPSNVQIIQIGASSDLVVNLLIKNSGFKQRFDFSSGAYKVSEIYQYMSISPKNAALSVAISKLAYIESLLHFDEEMFCDYLGAPFGHERNKRFRWYLNYMLQVSQNLIRVAKNIQGLHAVIATDLVTLPAALVVASIFEIPIIYDAHEFWSEADVESLEYEKEFWVELERSFLPYTNYRQTVSTYLSEYLSLIYNINFEFLPNCVPKKSIPENLEYKTNIENCKFIFQGGIAPKRGLDILIKNWVGAPKNALLYIRGCDNEYKNELISLARNLNLYKKQVFFLSPVNEIELISALSDFDVGIIPYEPFGNNNKYCCPNKLSQYMAACKPILSNNTKYVSKILQESGGGVFVDFNDAPLFLENVCNLVNDINFRRNLALSGYHYVLNIFNWETQSLQFYKQMQALVSNRSVDSLVIVKSHEKYIGAFQSQQVKKVCKFQLKIHLNRHAIPPTMLNIIKKMLPNSLKKKLLRYVYGF